MNIDIIDPNSGLVTVMRVEPGVGDFIESSRCTYIVRDFSADHTQHHAYLRVLVEPVTDLSKPSDTWFSTAHDAGYHIPPRLGRIVSFEGGDTGLHFPKKLRGAEEQRIRQKEAKIWLKIERIVWGDNSGGRSTYCVTVYYSRLAKHSEEVAYLVAHPYLSKMSPW